MKPLYGVVLSFLHWYFDVVITKFYITPYALEILLENIVEIDYEVENKSLGESDFVRSYIKGRPLDMVYELGNDITGISEIAFSVPRRNVISLRHSDHDVLPAIIRYVLKNVSMNIDMMRLRDVSNNIASISGGGKVKFYAEIVLVIRLLIKVNAEQMEVKK
eukprot:TRINITY_DN977_c0_g1_i2.p1 TRINITY_DN977_c0_g1~~TRINITY_DN977_c0_g1_i2.p1  ORF type:complete len:162 (-),score=28.85 TRINITY_DN977_c0_g1_i2:22-507(-)